MGGQPGNRVHLKTGCCFLILASLAFLGCSGRNVVFATGTSIGLDVHALTTNVPNKIAVGYDRYELVYVPAGTAGEPSVIGKMDAELSWMNGALIYELFATGDAAGAVADVAATQTEIEKGPLVVTTGTRFGLNLDFGAESQGTASFLLGYKRFNFALVPVKEGSNEIQSVFADISIHSSGLIGDLDGKRLNGREVSKSGGVRIVQTIATGKAATEIASKKKVEILKKVAEPCLTPEAE